MLTNKQIFRKVYEGSGEIDVTIIAADHRVMVLKEIRLSTDDNVTAEETLDVSVTHANSAIDSLIRSESLKDVGGPAGAVGITTNFHVAPGDSLAIAWANSDEIDYLLEVFYELEY